MLRKPFPFTDLCARHHDAAAQIGLRFNLRGGLDDRAPQLGGRVDVGALDDPRRLVRAAEGPVENSVEVALRRAEVVPEALGDDRGERRAGGEERLVEHGDEVSRTFGNTRQELRLENLRAGEDEVPACRGVGQAAAPEGGDAIVFESDAAAEGVRVGLAMDEECRRRPAPGVRGEEGLDRPTAETVAVDDDHPVGLLEEGPQWRQCSGGAEKLLLLGVDQRHAAKARAEAVADLASEVVQVDRHRFAAGGAQALECPGEERPPRDRQERFGQRRRQRAQSLAAVVTERLWHDLGTPQRYLDAVLDWTFRGSNQASRIVKGAEVAPSARLRRTIVEAGANVEAEADLRSCVVMPGAKIGKGVRLARSVVGPGATVAAGTQVESTLFALDAEASETRMTRISR